MKRRVQMTGYTILKFWIHKSPWPRLVVTTCEIVAYKDLKKAEDHFGGKAVKVKLIIQEV